MRSPCEILKLVASHLILCTRKNRKRATADLQALQTYLSLQARMSSANWCKMTVCPASFAEHFQEESLRRVALFHLQDT